MRIYILTLFIYFVGINSSFSNSPEHESITPNFIVILTDDFSAKVWGIYNQGLDHLIDNPNIKRLAREGSILTNLFSVNSSSTSGRATILTGQYSNHNGVYTDYDTLVSESNLITVLKEFEYHTSIIGKWQLKREPKEFKYYNVIKGQGQYNNAVFHESTDWLSDGKMIAGYSSNIITDLSLDWLKKREKGIPFLLMCNYKSAQDPFDYPDEYAAYYNNIEIPEPESLLDFFTDSNRTFPGRNLEMLAKQYLEDNTGLYPGEKPNLEGLDSADVRRAVYRKLIIDVLRCGKVIDDNIGRILGYLDETKLNDSTVVIVTSDQGYFLGEHGFFGNEVMYDEALRLPFVIRFVSDDIHADAKVNEIVSNTDIAPTILGLAGLNIPEWMDGKSFHRLLIGQVPLSWRKEFYFRNWEHTEEVPAHFGIRTAQEKLIFFYGQDLKNPISPAPSSSPAWEYYVLKDDPYERNNQYSNPEYSQIINGLKSKILAERGEIGDTDENDPIMTEILEDNLRPSTTLNIQDVENDDIQIICYPNPTNKWLNIQFSKNYSGPIRLTIFNLGGMKISEKVIELHEQNGQYQINISSLNSGIYLINIATPTGSETVKFVKG